MTSTCLYFWISVGTCPGTLEALFWTCWSRAPPLCPWDIDPSSQTFWCLLPPWSSVCLKPSVHDRKWNKGSLNVWGEKGKGRLKKDFHHFTVYSPLFRMTSKGFELVTCRLSVPEAEMCLVKLINAWTHAAHFMVKHHVTLWLSSRFKQVLHLELLPIF